MRKLLFMGVQEDPGMDEMANRMRVYDGTGSGPETCARCDGTGTIADYGDSSVGIPPHDEPCPVCWGEGLVPPKAKRKNP